MSSGQSAACSLWGSLSPLQWALSGAGGSVLEVVSRRLPCPGFWFQSFALLLSLRFGSPQRDPNWSNERPTKPPRHQGSDGTSAAPRTFTSRSSAGTGRMPPPRNYPRVGGYKETRPGYRASEASVQHPSRNGEQGKQESGYRAKRSEQSPPREKSPEVEAGHVHSSPVKEEGALENQSDAVQPPPDRPIEKKSYSRARRTRVKAGDAGKLADDVPALEAPATPKPVQAEASPPPAKSSNWESPVESSLDGLEQEMIQMNLTEQNWSPGQSQFLQPRELRGECVPAGSLGAAAPAWGLQPRRRSELSSVMLSQLWRVVETHKVGKMQWDNRKGQNRT